MGGGSDKDNQEELEVCIKGGNDNGNQDEQEISVFYYGYGRYPPQDYTLGAYSPRHGYLSQGCPDVNYLRRGCPPGFPLTHLPGALNPHHLRHLGRHNMGLMLPMEVLGDKAAIRAQHMANRGAYGYGRMCHRGHMQGGMFKHGKREMFKQGKFGRQGMEGEMFKYEKNEMFKHGKFGRQGMEGGMFKYEKNEMFKHGKFGRQGMEGGMFKPEKNEMFKNGKFGRQEMFGGKQMRGNVWCRIEEVEKSSNVASA